MGVCGKGDGVSFIFFVYVLHAACARAGAVVVVVVVGAAAEGVTAREVGLRHEDMSEEWSRNVTFVVW